MEFILHLVQPGAASATTRTLQEGTYIIGRSAGARLMLPYQDVSERHALLMLRGSRATIEDLGSSNGTVVNGQPIYSPCELGADSVVSIGSCMLRVSPASAVSEQDNDDDAAQEEDVSMPRVPYSDEPQARREADPQSAVRRAARSQIQAALIDRLDMKRLAVAGLGKEELEAKALAKIREIVSEVVSSGRLPPGIDPARLERDVFNEAMRLGPLEDLLADDSVTEIMVNGPRQVYVERGGRLEPCDMEFTDDASVMAVIERIVSPLGRRIDESQPYVDARLADGSRVNAIIPPLALTGPTITIRKFSSRTYGVEDFVKFGTWTRNAAEFMRACVVMRKNIVVAGGTGSGKTTLLNLLSGFIPSSERIVTIEDAAELKLAQPHVVRLEARPPNIEGRGAVTIRDLVKNSLRMRPDRIIVGECRGGEALDMLQAMNTGHDGSLTTVHANSPRDVVSRLETMVLMSGMDLPSRAIREQIAGAVDIIIHESRMADGTRKVVAISEVTGMEGSQIVMQDIFSFRQTGVDSSGRILGSFRATGAVPTFYETIKSRGLHLDAAIFDPATVRDIRLERTGGFA